MAVEASIIIPTLDDEIALPAAVDRLNTAIAAGGASAEVLIVDAGSKDRTLEVAAGLADRFPLLHIRVFVQELPYAGIGTVVRLGVAYSRGRYCFVVMPGGRDPVELVPQFLNKLRGGADLVLLSRYEEGGSAGETPKRYIAYQAVYRRAIKLVLGVDIPDSTYGFRGFSRTFVSAVGLSGRRFSVFPELTFKVLLAGGEIARVPGRPSTPLVHQQSKFRLKNELLGYALVLSRAGLHRAGWHWF